MKKIYLIVVAILFIVSSCSTKTDGYLGEPSAFDTGSNGIPSDASAQANPIVSTTNTVIPNAIFYTKQGLNSNIIYVDLTGINDPNTQQWLQLFGTSLSGQNIWLEVDGVPKGILVVNNTGTGNSVKADLVFLVDNSGSMDQEADSVANDIVAWSAKLAQQGLDLRFGCVGYSVSGYVDGGINLTTQENINLFLNRSGLIGTDRTMGFLGSDSTILRASANTSYANCTDECGVQALRFADQKYSFRTGANRIYINFTDEPNQPNSLADWSVEFLKDQSNWNTSQGTVHTVFSSDTTSASNYWSSLMYERPWLMSDYTGGTKLFVQSDFSGVNLNNLPVTGAITNTYTLSFCNTSSVTNGQHIVKITVKATNGQVTAEKIFTNVRFGN
jgi:hypothetical protein